MLPLQVSLAALRPICAPGPNRGQCRYLEFGHLLTLVRQPSSPMRRNCQSEHSRNVFECGDNFAVPVLIIGTPGVPLR